MIESFLNDENKNKIKNVVNDFIWPSKVYSIIIVFVYSILFHPCGLAYKIMRYTYKLVTPFNIFQNMYIENDINTENNSLEVKKKHRIRKLNIERI